MADEKIIFSMNGVGKVLPHNNKVILKVLCLCRKAAKQSDGHCGQNPLIEFNCSHNLLILKLQILFASITESSMHFFGSLYLILNP